MADIHQLDIYRELKGETPTPRIVEILHKSPEPIPFRPTWLGRLFARKEKEAEFGVSQAAREARVEQLWIMACDSVFWEFGNDGLKARLQAKLRAIEAGERSDV